MWRNTITILPLIFSASVSGHVNQLCQHDDVLRIFQSISNLGGHSSHARREVTMSAGSRNHVMAAAFLPVVSPSMTCDARSTPAVLRHSAVVTRANTNDCHPSTILFGKGGRPALSFPFFEHKHPPSYRCAPLARGGSLAASIGDSGDSHENMETEGKEPQRGMEEAFVSLETLSPEDWDENYNKDNNNRDGNDAVSLKYCRTDATPASDLGKSTEEDRKHYLEMQGELEGTTSSSPESIQNEEGGNHQSDLETDQMVMDQNYVSDDMQEENYPWASINPILRVRGPVASGYGRGGKKLGVPTANLPASLFQSALEDVANGVYFGWAVIEQRQPSDDDSSAVTKTGRNVPVKAVVNVGYSPTFEGKENKEKIVEAHIITKSSPMGKVDRSSVGEEEEHTTANTEQHEDVEITEDFYDETLRLQLIGYLRPEQKFASFPDLIAQIHLDISHAHWALDTMPFVFSKEDPFLQLSGSGEEALGWMGQGGGDGVASWEFETW